MITEVVKEQKPIKCTLTRIMDDFTGMEEYNQYDKSILKNYVYIPEKKIIA